MRRRPRRQQPEQMSFEVIRRPGLVVAGRWWSRGVLLPLLLVLLLSMCTLLRAQCPWPRSPAHSSLHSDCVCGYSNVRRLSVQCSPVANFSQLLEVLNSPSVQRLPIDLLYLNNATGLRVLPRNAFRQLDIQQFHLANTRLEAIERGAFAGLETRLVSLTLQNTGLKDIPLAELASLRALRTLDLSNNRIRAVRPHAFKDLGQLSTLRLAFNPELRLDRDAFQGIERSLKNLNLKGIGAKTVPEAIQNLSELAFLDLAQNRIAELEPRGLFHHLHSLTALSLERNLIRSIHADTFAGLNDSLSSLSLLNNLLTDFPQAALSKLTGLRVLDLGFNGIRHLGSEAFTNNKLLTLLALDGNPLKTLSIATFAHLNSTLRGLSFGGKQFECDCHVKWMSRWASEYSLQVTSRERNPQFCAYPPHLRNKMFTQIDPDDFICPPTYLHEQSPKPAVAKKAATTTTTTAMITMITTLPPATASTTRKSRVKFPPSKPVTGFIHVSLPQETGGQQRPQKKKQQPAIGLARSSMTLPKSTTTTTAAAEVSSPSTLPPSSAATSTATSLSHNLVLASEATPMVDDTEFDVSSFESKRDNLGNNKLKQRPGGGGEDHKREHRPQQPSSSLRLTEVQYNNNNSIHLRWSVSRPSRTGYQIVYRYFGSKEYHRGDRVIDAHQTSHQLSDYIAPNELIVVCVLRLDETPTFEMLNEAEEKEPNLATAIPSQQCRELSTKLPPLTATPSSPILVKKLGSYRFGSTASGNMSTTSSTGPTLSLSKLYPAFQRLNDVDKIVIAISAAVCIFIIVAVLAFSCCFYRSVAKDSPMRTLATSATCFSSKSLSPLAKSVLERHGAASEGWDTMSVYSTRSIPRARLPPAALNGPTGTLRSHVSGAGGVGGHRYFGGNIGGSTLPPPKSNDRARWLPDGYMHHYPSMNQLPAISYGTHVTATGGGGGGLGPVLTPYNFPMSDPGNLRSLGRPMAMSQDMRSANHNQHQKPTKSRNRTRAARSKMSSAHNVGRAPNSNQYLSGVANGLHPPPEFRIHSKVAGSNSSSGHRLLLSSSSNNSNSLHSQNEYDSDWNGSGAGVGLGTPLTHFGGTHTVGSRGVGAFATNNNNNNSHRMTENEVDIYVDKNYARRFA